MSVRLGWKANWSVPTVAGELAEVWRYPVKSLLGQHMTDPVTVTANGMDGDRVAAWVDVDTGAIASAKRPARWSALLQLRAETTGDFTHVTFPDGSRWGLTDERTAERVSSLVGRTLRLSHKRVDGDFLERADPEDVLNRGIASPDVRFESNPVGRAVPGPSFHDFAPIHLVTTSSLSRVSQHVPAPALEAMRYRPNLIITTPSGTHAELD